uniref:Ribosomal protein L34Ae n=1 Tax=Cajanus cajan TaxID=3821 RepID=A0A151TFI6_CAJCA|nr:hypothetical protein KK1_012067 [Cajanus cajan]
MAKTHFDSINLRVVIDFVCVNMLWAFASLRVFVCNYVLYAFRLLLGYILRFLHLGDAKDEVIVQKLPHVERNQVSDSEVDGFREELVSFLFWSEDFHGETESSVFFMEVGPESEKKDGDTECSVLMDTHCGVHEDGVKTEVPAESFVSEEIDSEPHIHEDGFVFVESDSEISFIDEDNKEIEREGEEFVSMETDSDVCQDGKQIGEGETESSVLIENDSDLHHESMKIEEEIEERVSSEIDSVIHGEFKKIDENETGRVILMENVCGETVNEDVEKIDENEDSVFQEEQSNVHGDGTRKEEKVVEEEEESYGLDFVDTNSVTTTSKCEYLSGKDISGFMEEPTTLRFSFREFYMGPDVSTVSDNAYATTEIIADKEFSEFGSERDPVDQAQAEESVQEQVSVPSTHVPYFENEVFGGSDSSDEDYFLYNENSLTSDSESESSSSSDSAKDVVKDKKEEVCKNGLEKSEEARWEDELSESESDEGDFEWEHDDLVEQLKLELKNSRQGGLATILEEEEEEEVDEDEEKEKVKEKEARVSPRVVEDPKPVEIEEKLEYKDQIDEIEKVYKSYEEKMKKLDILNYQTMHALGLLQLKDPLKLISIPKSTIQGAKPVISQNLWPRKATKNSSDPLMKLVHELHRDLELVYVGQVCLSWEILSWQHKKALELQQYDSQGSHRYNHVAGEFQLFQVLVQRFIENEPFQGPRMQNYVKNRCVIRNLLQVPGIKDDSKGDEDENPIASGRLADIIKESMRMFWEFVRADKDYGNVIFKASQHNRTVLKDPMISGLMVDIKTQLQKKEKKLKDIVRTGNCIVKKFQKHHEDQLDHEQLVAQVGLRLISRVINMAKFRKEQLIWCNEKLHRVKFLSRKIVQVEPSFLLFPC